VVQSLARALYDQPMSISTRYHFITAAITEKGNLPCDWRYDNCDRSIAIHSNTRLPPDYFKDVMTSRYCVNDSSGIHVTLTELCAVHPINAGGLEPKIANYLQTAALNIDALVLDVQNEKLWGEPGKAALLDKRVEVNNLSHLIYKAFLARIEPRKYIEAHAMILGFNHSPVI